MIRKIIYISIVAILMQVSSANAGSTGSEKISSSNNSNTEECFEGFSRTMFKFNNALDSAVFEPVAKGYKKLPSPIQSGVSNFINNLKLPLAALNQLLQGQGKNAAESTGRFVVNSTIGIFGLIDVAENIISQKSSVKQISINIIILEAIRYIEIIKPGKNLYYYANQIINS